MIDRNLGNAIAMAILLFAVFPALLLPLAIYILYRALKAWQTWPRRAKETMRKHKALSILLFLVAVFLILYSFREFTPSSPKFLAFLQVISGNWSRDVGITSPELENFTTTLYAMLAVLLNFGPWLYIIAQIRNLLADKEKKSMEMLDGVTGYEAMAKQALYELLRRRTPYLMEEPKMAEAMADDIDACFDEARKKLLPHLAAVFGAPAAARYDELLHQQVDVAPKPR